jgi:hypothetical protein
MDGYTVVIWSDNTNVVGNIAVTCELDVCYCSVTFCKNKSIFSLRRVG